MLEQSSPRAPARQHNELVLKSYLPMATRKGRMTNTILFLQPLCGDSTTWRQTTSPWCHASYCIVQRNERTETNWGSFFLPCPSLPLGARAPTWKSQSKWEQQKHNSCLSSHFLPSREGYVFIASCPAQGILASAITEVINTIGAE